ncbi:MAG: hypothetical protein JO364_20435 [Pseudonocardiales bacterium]|nr:hypothetical protein [Pseudonocardiales bacterium]MBV9032621.1 hypothetical protein [Pseudonocardiales bacterium]
MAHPPSYDHASQAPWFRRDNSSTGTLLTAAEPSRPNYEPAHCRIRLYGIKHAASGGADVAESVVLRACPLGPVPLAARGLAAVLARAGPAGG